MDLKENILLTTNPCKLVKRKDNQSTDLGKGRKPKINSKNLKCRKKSVTKENKNMQNLNVSSRLTVKTIKQEYTESTEKAAILMDSSKETRFSDRNQKNSPCMESIYSRKLPRRKRKKRKGKEPVQKKKILVFLSEPQAKLIREQGRGWLSAPPNTPTPDEMEKYSCVRSLHDIKSQRLLKEKLNNVSKKLTEEDDKLKAADIKMNILKQIEKEKRLKHRQRLQIYALNNLMRVEEEKNFASFSNKVKSENHPADELNVTGAV